LLSELTDVNITTPADASLLFYDTATSKWIDNVVSGDITIADTGVATIQANSVALGTDTTGDYVGTVTAGTGLTSTGATSGEGFTNSDYCCRYINYRNMECYFNCRCLRR
jgi:hypothetical protein